MKKSDFENRKISELWKAGRLLIGKTQKELSLELGISQSSISKVETLGLEPSASDWYNFCRLVGIDAHKTMELGYIDGKKKFKHRLFSEALFKLPLKYKRDFSLKIRELIPFKDCVQSELGADAWEAFVEEKKIDGEMFLIYDFQVSMDLLNDLIRWCEERRFDVLEKVKPYSSSFSSHGILQEEYTRKKTATDLLKTMLDDQIFYQKVFRTEVHSTKRSLEASILINTEIPDFFKEDVVSQYVNYKIASFQEALRANANFNSEFDVRENGTDVRFRMAI